MQDILQKILTIKLQEVALAKKQLPLAEIQQAIAHLEKPRDFVRALQQKLQENKPAVIAEIKKASPSKGVIRENFDAVAIAKSYAVAGAACLSVLTDEQFFQGSLAYLAQVKSVCDLPLLRKDFVVDPYQIYETRLAGGDCILLIVAALTDEQLHDFSVLADTLELAVLVEVHDLAELQRALKLPTPLIGINNRDLHTFTTDLETTITLSQHIPADRIVITESGINTAQDIAKMRTKNIQTFLIGEALMRAADPGAALSQLLSS